MGKPTLEGKAVSADELSKQMKALQKELFTAKVHFDMFMGIRSRWTENIREIQCSPAFWQHTMDAHISTTVVRLCRVYDIDRSSIHLLRFLLCAMESSHLFSETNFRERHKDNAHVESLAKYPRTLNLADLQNDIAFCEVTNPLIKNLQRWRNFVVAHSNYYEAVLALTEFHTRYPLPFEDIKALIDRGFVIINRYSSLLNALHYSDQIMSHQERDYEFVLVALKAYRERSFPD